jgi:acetylornithine/LysW-gamma-L-lysine aminotransferase
MNAATELSNLYELPLFPKRKLTLERGLGAHVWDDTGKCYIDCAAGAGSVNVGHCNPAVVKAIQEQASRLITCTGIFQHDVRSRLMEKLVSVAPRSLSKVFLCNSGAESVEAAIKFARVSTGRPNLICAVRGFHGRTMGALSATHNHKYRDGFGPLVEGFQHVPFGSVEALSAAINEHTAGVMLEIVQGEGGVYVGEQEYFKAAQALCHERGALFIVDEIQTGFCRTGKMFACQHFGLDPDILCLAKSMAGGVPMGATLCSDKIKVEVGAHGTTFGGCPLACAAGLAALNFMVDENLAEAAEKKGAYFAEKLLALGSPKVRELRRLGLMVGLQLKEKSTAYLQALSDEGVLAIPAGPTVIRYLPPLVISYEDLDAVAAATGRVLAMET